jgi:bifunctional non-homologous end joining protein LigD
MSVEALENAIPRRLRPAAIRVEPSLLAEIEYRAKSAEGKVRHPVFKGIREDLQS